jgi:hypothetical protein
MKFEIDSSIGTPISKKAFLEKARYHRVPFVTFFIEPNDDLPSDWYLPSDIEMSNDMLEVEYVEKLFSRAGHYQTYMLII